MVGGDVLKLLSNSELQCGSDASHKVSVKSDYGSECILFKEFKQGHHGSYHGYQNRSTSVILNLRIALMFSSNRLMVLEMLKM